MDTTQWTFFINILVIAFLLWVVYKVGPVPENPGNRSTYRQGVGERLMKQASCQDYWEIGTAAKALGIATDEFQPSLDYFMSHGWVDARWTGVGEQMKREYFVTCGGIQRFSAPPEPSPALQSAKAR
jgi:hypothetical protein